MKLIIKCPVTGNDTPTGISIDRASFETATFTDNQVSCPHCGEDHVWGTKDAVLVE